jgi:hypothetical protein
MNSIIEVVQNIEDFYIYIKSLVDASLQNASTEPIEKEIPLEILDPAPLTNDNNIDPVIIIEKPIDLTGEEHTEYNLQIPLETNTEITTVSNEYSRKIQYDANTNINTIEEYLIQIPLHQNVSIDSTIDQLKVQYEILANNEFFVPILERVVSPVAQSANAATNYIGPFVGTYGDARISEFASATISSLASITFDTEILKSIRTLSRISGTVNVSSNIVFGTGTTFTSDFSPGSYFVVENEKFIVLSVANSTYMELNVPAQTTYTNVFAYS